MSSIRSHRLLISLLASLLWACGSSTPAPQTPPTEEQAPPPPTEAVAPDAAAATGPATAPAGATEDKSANPGINDKYKTEEGRKASVKIFEEGRDEYQKPAELMKSLALKPGMTVADLGAGSGYMEARLSAAVGPKGKVYAQDIQPEFLDLVKEKVAKHKLKNVELVVGDLKDPKLPPACCDVILGLDVYHHIEFPAPVMTALKKSLKPGGKLVLVDWWRKPNDFFTGHKVDIYKHVPLDHDDVVKQMEGFGWKHVETRKFLPYQYYAVFTL